MLPAKQITRELQALAAKMNDHHGSIVGAFKTGLDHAVACGRLLIQVKEILPHGDYISWQAANCQFSPQTAAGYVRAARHVTSLEASGGDASRLSLTETLKALTERSAEPAEPAEPTDKTRMTFEEATAAIEAMNANFDAATVAIVNCMDHVEANTTTIFDAIGSHGLGALPAIEDAFGPDFGENIRAIVRDGRTSRSAIRLVVANHITFGYEPDFAAIVAEGVADPAEIRQRLVDSLCVAA